MTKGEKIRYARINKGLTLEELANACETTKQTINKYEKGVVTNIPSDRVELLAKALDVSPTYIMGWDDGSDLDELEQKIMELYRSLSDSQKIALYEFMKSLKE